MLFAGGDNGGEPATQQRRHRSKGKLATTVWQAEPSASSHSFTRSHSASSAIDYSNGYEPNIGYGRETLRRSLSSGAGAAGAASRGIRFAGSGGSRPADPPAGGGGAAGKSSNGSSGSSAPAREASHESSRSERLRKLGEIAVAIAAGTFDGIDGGERASLSADPWRPPGPSSSSVDPPAAPGGRPGNNETWETPGNIKDRSGRNPRERATPPLPPGGLAGGKKHIKRSKSEKCRKESKTEGASDPAAPLSCSAPDLLGVWITVDRATPRSRPDGKKRSKSKKYRKASKSKKASGRAAFLSASAPDLMGTLSTRALPHGEIAVDRAALGNGTGDNKGRKGSENKSRSKERDFDSASGPTASLSKSASDLMWALPAGAMPNGRIAAGRAAPSGRPVGRKSKKTSKKKKYRKERRHESASEPEALDLMRKSAGASKNLGGKDAAGTKGGDKENSNGASDLSSITMEHPKSRIGSIFRKKRNRTEARGGAGVRGRVRAASKSAADSLRRYLFTSIRGGGDDEDGGWAEGAAKEGAGGDLPAFIMVPRSPSARRTSFNVGPGDELPVPPAPVRGRVPAVDTGPPRVSRGCGALATDCSKARARSREVGPEKAPACAVDLPWQKTFGGDDPG